MGANSIIDEMFSKMREKRSERTPPVIPQQTASDIYPKLGFQELGAGVAGIPTVVAAPYISPVTNLTSKIRAEKGSLLMPQMPDIGELENIAETEEFQEGAFQFYSGLYDKWANIAMKNNIPLEYVPDLMKNDKETVMSINRLELVRTASNEATAKAKEILENKDNQFVAPKVYQKAYEYINGMMDIKYAFNDSQTLDKLVELSKYMVKTTNLLETTSKAINKIPANVYKDFDLVDGSIIGVKHNVEIPTMEQGQFIKKTGSGYEFDDEGFKTYLKDVYDLEYGNLDEETRPSFDDMYDIGIRMVKRNIARTLQSNNELRMNFNGGYGYAYGSGSSRKFIQYQVDEDMNIDPYGDLMVLKEEDYPMSPPPDPKRYSLYSDEQITFTKDSNITTYLDAKEHKVEAIGTIPILVDKNGKIVNSSGEVDLNLIGFLTPVRIDGEDFFALKKDISKSKLYNAGYYVDYVPYIKSSTKTEVIDFDNIDAVKTKELYSIHLYKNEYRNGVVNAGDKWGTYNDEVFRTNLKKKREKARKEYEEYILNLNDVRELEPIETPVGQQGNEDVKPVEEPPMTHRDTMNILNSLKQIKK